jgi:hypothetical protein
VRHSQPNLITVLQINRRTFIILLGNIILMLKLLFSGSFRASTLAYYYFLANSTGSFDSSGPEACVCVCVCSADLDQRLESSGLSIFVTCDKEYSNGCASCVYCFCCPRSESIVFFHAAVVR